MLARQSPITDNDADAVVGKAHAVGNGSYCAVPQSSYNRTAGYVAYYDDSFAMQCVDNGIGKQKEVGFGYIVYEYERSGIGICVSICIDGFGERRAAIYSRGIWLCDFIVNRIVAIFPGVDYQSGIAVDVEHGE